MPGLEVELEHSEKGRVEGTKTERVQATLRTSADILCILNLLD